MCSSTQKCSSKEICAVLLSKMCSWQMDNISLKTVCIFSFNIKYSRKFEFVINKQIINQFGVLVSFILGVAHSVDTS